MCLFSLLLIIIIFAAKILSQPINWKFKQEDYDLKGVKVVIPSYNKEYFKNVVPREIVVWDNDTSRPLNGSGVLLRELGNNVQIEGEVFKLIGREYKYFPISGIINVCHEVELNKEYGKEFIKRKNVITNIKLECPMKPGFYYINNISPDYSLLPPYMPRGSYKIVGKVYEKSNFLMEVDGFATVVDRPKTSRKSE